MAGHEDDAWDFSMVPDVRDDASFSVYVHVPFCATRCGYCDFNTYVPGDQGSSIEEYLRAAHQEIELAKRVVKRLRPGIDTVFFGGGTPTMLTPAQLGELVRHLDHAWGIAGDAEVTSEANPETLSLDYLRELRQSGINRLSMGMQSSSAHVLAVLERTHTPGHALDMVRAARQAGFESISFDLIFGTPGESMADWERTLGLAIDAGVDHISAYSLIIESRTRLALKVRKGEVCAPTEDDLADKYLRAESMLRDAGFANYETSNWAISPDARSRHNLAYWQGGAWWGIGPGAHSHIDGVRWWNKKLPRSYAADLSQGLAPVQGLERLDPQQRRIERVMLELRLSRGVSLDVLTESERARVPAIVDDGLVRVVDGRLATTLAGRLLADGIVRDLLD